MNCLNVDFTEIRMKNGRLHKIRPGSWKVVEIVEPGWYKIENIKPAGSRGVKASCERVTEGYVRSGDWIRRLEAINLYRRVEDGEVCGTTNREG